MDVLQYNDIYNYTIAVIPVVYIHNVHNNPRHELQGPWVKPSLQLVDNCQRKTLQLSEFTSAQLNTAIFTW